ncbi:MAG: hypothetical protein M0D53_01035 [Flavobacterium sp. JAD_PAG50586_2]|nr:MAG: hypothetical protein M0D53_01035 [Flavobacterium sp. JAD_PAG50586_2]
MIDVTTIEIVTPDIQRPALIESNNRLKNLSILLITALVVVLAVYTNNYLDQEQNKEK